MNKYCIKIKPNQQPIRIDAYSEQGAYDIAMRVFGSVVEVYKLFDWVDSKPVFVEQL